RIDLFGFQRNSAQHRRQARVGSARLKLRSRTLLLSLLCVACSQGPDMTGPTPPAAARKPYAFTQHGITIEDPYHWLKDPAYPDVKDPEILGYLRAENAYVDA